MWNALHGPQRSSTGAQGVSLSCLSRQAVLLGAVSVGADSRVPRLVYSGRHDRLSCREQTLPPLQATRSLLQCAHSPTGPDRMRELAWLVRKVLQDRVVPDLFIGCRLHPWLPQRYWATCCSAPYCPRPSTLDSASHQLAKTSPLQPHPALVCSLHALNGPRLWGY